MLTSKVTCRHFDRSQFHFFINWIIFSVYPTSWACQYFPTFISVQSSILTPWRRDWYKKKKNRWRWARRYELNMNKEFCVENSRSIFNNIGFACISQSGKTQSTKFEFGSHQYGKSFREFWMRTQNRVLKYDIQMYIRTPIQVKLLRKRQRMSWIQNWFIITCRYPNTMLVILKNCTWTYNENYSVNRETICQRWTSTRWSKEYFQTHIWMTRYILDTMNKRITFHQDINFEKINIFENIPQKLTLDQSDEVLPITTSEWNTIHGLESLCTRESRRAVESNDIRFSTSVLLTWQN